MNLLIVKINHSYGKIMEKSMNKYKLILIIMGLLLTAINFKYSNNFDFKNLKKKQGIP